MSEASDIAFMSSVLIPALALLALISARKFAQAVEATAGRVPANLRLLDDSRFEWALYGAAATLFCAALTGASCYAAGNGSLLLGAGSGVAAAMLARALIRLPVDPHDLRESAKALLVPPVMFAVMGMALSLLYSPAATAY